MHLFLYDFPLPITTSFCFGNNVRVFNSVKRFFFLQYSLHIRGIFRQFVFGNNLFKISSFFERYNYILDKLQFFLDFKKLIMSCLVCSLIAIILLALSHEDLNL